MRIISIFKITRHREFNYQPLYYDAEKEQREKRVQRIKAELNIEENKLNVYKPGITRGSMRHYIKNQKRSTLNRNIRLIVILAILTFIAYLLLYVDFQWPV